jgi:Fe-S cluster assembly ATPase SufC
MAEEARKRARRGIFIAVIQPPRFVKKVNSEKNLKSVLTASCAMRAAS